MRLNAVLCSHDLHLSPFICDAASGCSLVFERNTVVPLGLWARLCVCESLKRLRWFSRDVQNEVSLI